MTFYFAPMAKSADLRIKISCRQEIISKVANSEKNVLILGETGTGKDYTARKIHALSTKRSGPFVAINCANIPENLFEAELFGYARGAFTGATKDKNGLLEVARDGTIFLDEIGELSPYLQAKILRVIEEKEIRRIGETVQRRIQARFIFATNRELQEEMRLGKFRKDLYFRISVVKIHLPPLRERKREIPLLVKEILRRENEKERTKKIITAAAMKKLLNYDFPGNIRELENILERAFLLSDETVISDEHIRLENELESSREKDMFSPERLRRVLENCQWNKSRAATEIGKSRRQFYRLLERSGMTDHIRKRSVLRRPHNENDENPCEP